MTAAGGGGAAAFFLVFLMGLYFAPLIVAVVGKVPDAGPVAVINFFVGWTLIVALAMAARSAPTPATGRP